VIGPGVLLLLAVPAVFGVPLACVGVILRLCEWSWHKPAGSMGSLRLLVASALLVLPALLWLFWAVGDSLARTGRPW
jgi:hypothetical protein